MANEPAFPVQDCAAFQYPGMTLRDWFAGQALAHAAELRYAEYYNKNDCQEVRKMIARHCYDIADAMLAEREKPDAQ